MMFAANLSLACLCILLAAAIVLLRSHDAPAGVWTSLSRAPPASSICPPAWRPGHDDNGTSPGTYRQCLARHGRDLRTGYSLRYAHTRLVLSSRTSSRLLRSTCATEVGPLSWDQRQGCRTATVLQRTATEAVAHRVPLSLLESGLPSNPSCRAC